jgi:Fe-S-cluster containining protein
MQIDFGPFFKRYEVLAKKASQVFEKVTQLHPDCVKCALQCSDCCHALFDLTLIEALYINHHFHEAIKGSRKAALLELASKADRQVYRIKKNAYKAQEAGQEENQILEGLAAERVRCPLLNGENQCELYDFRPITCRLYGIPTSIGGESYTCGKSDFKPGQPYPTVHLDKIQGQLFELSHDLVDTIRSRYTKMGELLVPLSMALLTDYNEEYLGLAQGKTDEIDKKAKKVGS